MRPWINQAGRTHPPLRHNRQCGATDRVPLGPVGAPSDFSGPGAGESRANPEPGRAREGWPRRSVRLVPRPVANPAQSTIRDARKAGGEWESTPSAHKSAGSQTAQGNNAAGRCVVCHAGRGEPLTQEVSDERQK